MDDPRTVREQATAEVCDVCGWAMKFPDEPCANCERFKLRAKLEECQEVINDLRGERGTKAHLDVEACVMRRDSSEGSSEIVVEFKGDHRRWTVEFTPEQFALALTARVVRNVKMEIATRAAPKSSKGKGDA